MKCPFCGNNDTQVKDSRSRLFVPTFPICGKVKLIICPAYEGSEIISWYPVIEVLKHTSPVAVPS